MLLLVTGMLKRVSPLPSKVAEHIALGQERLHASRDPCHDLGSDWVISRDCSDRKSHLAPRIRRWLALGSLRDHPSREQCT